MNKSKTLWPRTDVVVLSPAEVRALQAQLKRDLAELDLLLDELAAGELSGEFSGNLGGLKGASP